MTGTPGRPYLPAGPATLVRDVGPPLALACALVLVGHWHGYAAGSTLPWPATALVVAASLVLALRRPWPLAAYGASVAVVGAYLVAGFPVGPIMVAPFAGLLHLVAYGRLRPALVAAAAGGVVLAAAHQHTAGWVGAGLFLTIWIALAALFGGVQAVRRAFEVEARAGRAWAERSRDEEARRRLAEERLRVAREVHDVVGHSLAVITLQAGVAEHLLAGGPAQGRDALAAIRDVSRQALEELRTEVAALRGEAGAGLERAPGPGLSDLPDLVAAMRAAGLEVSLVSAVDPAVRIPVATASAAYRIVQESLTNVVRHAGAGARARVGLSVDGSALHVAVTDSGLGPAAAPTAGGSGITGMRERTRALGGTLETGAGAAGGFAVHARLPLAGGEGPA